MNESDDNGQYTSWDVQNQIINLLSSNILERMMKEFNQYVGDSRSTRPLIIQKRTKSFVIKYTSKDMIQKEVFMGYHDCFSLTNQSH